MHFTTGLGEDVTNLLTDPARITRVVIAVQNQQGFVGILCHDGSISQFLLCWSPSNPRGYRKSITPGSCFPLIISRSRTFHVTTPFSCLLCLLAATIHLIGVRRHLFRRITLLFLILLLLSSYQLPDLRYVGSSQKRLHPKPNPTRRTQRSLWLIQTFRFPAY